MHPFRGIQNSRNSRIQEVLGCEECSHVNTGQRPNISSLSLDNQGSRYQNIFPQPGSPRTNANASVGVGVGVGVEASKRAQHFKPLDEIDVFAHNYGFIRPLPAKIAPEDIDYLRVKGALSVPSFALQKALLRAYAENVHPYMPLLDLHDFLSIIDAHDGSRGQTSLFLYQAVMFCATAFVSNKILKEAGYASRKAARRTLFSKARVRIFPPIQGGYWKAYICSSYTISTVKTIVYFSFKDFS